MFGGSKRFSAQVIPWCTYTAPEVAHVGLYERDIAARGLESDTYSVQLKHNDRAICEGSADDVSFGVAAKVTDAREETWPRAWRPLRRPAFPHGARHRVTRARPAALINYATIVNNQMCDSRMYSLMSRRRRPV